MKALLLVVILFLLPFESSCQQDENRYTRFLEEQETTAKEYVINQFKESDIVVICERHHREFTQYELLLSVVKDSYFADNVGVIYTEIGMSNIDSKLNAFLRSEMADSVGSMGRLTAIFRDADSSPNCHTYSFPWLIWAVFKLNQRLPSDKKIAIHPVSESMDWNEIRTVQDMGKWDEQTYAVPRDIIMANTIIDNFESNAYRKALVIMNNKHAFMKSYTLADGRENLATTDYLTRHFGNRLRSIYLMGLAPVDGEYTVVQHGAWDYVFEKSNKVDVGFDLKNSPFGPAPCDLIPSDAKDSFTYDALFTGLIYYKPVAEHILMSGWSGFVDENFRDEFLRRVKLFCAYNEIECSDEFAESRICDINYVKREKYQELEAVTKIINAQSGRLQ